jgi:hypothetical protein
MKKIFTLLALTITFSMNAQNNNTTTGIDALSSGLLSGSFNSAFGHSALKANTNGSSNVGIGNGALTATTSGERNSGVGTDVLDNNLTGSRNTASGFSSLGTQSSGDNNTASGVFSLNNNVSGSNNSAFGYNAHTSTNNSTNQTVIGYEATGQADNSVVLGNDDVTAVYMGEDSGAKVYAGDGSFTGDMTIGGDVVVSSDARLKSNIVSLGSTLSRLLLIDGKSYEMKGKQKIGVLAQEIKEVFPELVTEDDNEMLAVNYQGLVPVLINALKEQDDKISRLENLVEKLISDK